MGDFKQRLQDALQAAKSEGRRSDDPVDPREAKKRATSMYHRRKLEKDVRNYIKGLDKYHPIRSRELDRIGRKWGFHISGTP